MDNVVLDLNQKKFFDDSFIQMLFTVLESRDKARFQSANAYRNRLKRIDSPLDIDFHNLIDIDFQIFASSPHFVFPEASFTWK